jgi:hypothetical protein
MYQAKIRDRLGMDAASGQDAFEFLRMKWPLNSPRKQPNFILILGRFILGLKPFVEKKSHFIGLDEIFFEKLDACEKSLCIFALLS